MKTSFYIKNYTKYHFPAKLNLRVKDHKSGVVVAWLTFNCDAVPPTFSTISSSYVLQESLDPVKITL